MESEPLFLSDGTAYSGPVFTDPKDRAFGEVNAPCPSCRGRGEGMRGGRCRRCGGDKTVFEQVLVYTSDELAKRTRRSEKRRTGKMDAERERLERIASNHRDCVEQHPDVYEGARRWPNDRYVADLLEKSEIYGGLTEPQIRALKAAVDRNDGDLQRYGNSSAVGQEGDRLEMDAVCRRAVRFTREKLYGIGSEEVWFLEMDDAQGNALAAVTNMPGVIEGDPIRISGTVKGVDASKGWTRTLLSHLKIMECAPEAAPAKRFV